MKIKKAKLLLTLLVAFSISIVSAQDKATSIKKEAPKSNKEIEKVKDQKSDFDEKVDAKGQGGSFTDAASTAKGKPVQMDKDAMKGDASAKDKISQIEERYSKKIRSTKDPKEQAKLKEEMQEKVATIKSQMGKDGGEVVNNASGNNSNESSSGAVKPKENPYTDATTSKGKPTVAIKNEKISSTKANISNRRKSLDNRRAMVEKANAKVAAAKASLDAAKDDGSLSEEEIAAKEAKIASAEAQIKKLEASIDKAEKKFDENDAKLSDFGKDKEN